MPFVDEPEASLHGDDGFADDREAEVSGFDQAGVHRADRDLVHAVTFDFDKRERVAGLVDQRCRAGVVPQGMPAVGPVLVMHEAAEERVADG